MEDFVEQLERLINLHCLENKSQTPDFILARYLRACLDAFDQALKDRTAWYAPPEGSVQARARSKELGRDRPELPTGEPA